MKPPTYHPLDADPARSWTLPSWTYFEPEIYARERAAIFLRCWHFVCHAAELAEAGSYRTVRLLDQGVLVVRDEAGGLRAFHNVCRHRGHELAQGCGVKRLLSCPYHAWTYGLDGSLKHARGTAGLPGFERTAFGLAPVRLEVFHGLVFVTFDASAQPFGQSMAGLDEELAASFPDLAAYRFLAGETRRVAMNWKTRMDNSLECYHCRPAHPSFCRLVEMEGYRSIDRGLYTRHVGKARSPGGGDYLYWHLWPLTEFNATSVGPMFSVFATRPLAPELCDLELSIYVPRDLSAEAEAAVKAAWLGNETNEEDVRLCESVQRGLRSVAYSQGRYVVDAARTHISEHSLHAFHRRVAALVGL
jgi:phenylpropionate dioxygenase-like ring-hydroxylating dioxygenase large terminal subunit